MSASQLELDEWTRFHARRTDPETSQKAAASVATSKDAHLALILSTLRRSVAPLTGEEIAKVCGLTMVQVCRRLPDLKKSGQARPTEETRPTSTGRSARCWEATP